MLNYDEKQEGISGQASTVSRRCVCVWKLVEEPVTKAWKCADREKRLNLAIAPPTFILLRSLRKVKAEWLKV